MVYQVVLDLSFCLSLVQVRSHPVSWVWIVLRILASVDSKSRQQIIGSGCFIKSDVEPSPQHTSWSERVHGLVSSSKHRQFQRVVDKWLTSERSALMENSEQRTCEVERRTASQRTSDDACTSDSSFFEFNFSLMSSKSCFHDTLYRELSRL